MSFKNYPVTKYTFSTDVYEIQTEISHLNIIQKVVNSKFYKEDMLTTYDKNTNCLLQDQYVSLKDHVYSILKVFTESICGKKDFFIQNAWFQGYVENQFHGMHCHDLREEHYSMIMYLQCTDNSSETVLRCPGYPYILMKDIVYIKPKEGKIVIFPGYVPHEVKPNKDDKRIILSLNFYLK